MTGRNVYHAVPARAQALTARQHEVYALLRRYQAEHGHTPTVRELARALGIGSSAAHAHLNELELRGAIERIPGVKNGITLRQLT